MSDLYLKIILIIALIGYILTMSILFFNYYIKDTKKDKKIMTSEEIDNMINKILDSDK